MYKQTLWNFLIPSTLGCTSSWDRQNGVMWPRFVRAASAFCQLHAKVICAVFFKFHLLPIHHTLNWQVFYADNSNNEKRLEATQTRCACCNKEDPQADRQTNTQTDRGNYNTLRSLACSVTTLPSWPSRSLKTTILTLQYNTDTSA